MDERTKSTLQSIVKGATDLADGIELGAGRLERAVDKWTVSIVRALDNFAARLEDEIYQAEQARVDEDNARAEAMAKHPAGKGRVENNSSNITREEKIKVVQDWLQDKTGVWHTNPDKISDAAVDAGYRITKF